VLWLNARGHTLTTSTGSLGHPGDLDFVEGVPLHYALGLEPGTEGPYRAEVGVHRVGRQPPILEPGEGMAGEASLLLEIEDEAPHLLPADPGDIGGESLGA
jgi:hypothetical protein